MKQAFHYSPKTGKMERCTNPENCLYGGTHFENPKSEEAMDYMEKRIKEENDSIISNTIYKNSPYLLEQENLKEYIDYGEVYDYSDDKLDLSISAREHEIPKLQRKIKTLKDQNEIKRTQILINEYEEQLSIFKSVKDDREHPIISNKPKIPSPTNEEILAHKKNKGKKKVFRFTNDEKKSLDLFIDPAEMHTYTIKDLELGIKAREKEIQRVQQEKDRSKDRLQNVRYMFDLEDREGQIDILKAELKRRQK